MKAFGTNTIKVGAIDPTANHDGCMRILADEQIHVVVDLPSGDISWPSYGEDWNLKDFDRYAAIVDAFATYDNLLAFTVAQDVVYDRKSCGQALDVKAATRDVKNYIAAREYRPIPLGYYTWDMDYAFGTSLQEYLLCQEGAPPHTSLPTLDFFMVSVSGALDTIDSMSSHYQQLPVPITFVDYDQTAGSDGRFWEIEGMVFGETEANIWSGTITDIWVGYEAPGLVKYSHSYGWGTPTALAPFTDLSSRWATLAGQGVNSSDHTFTVTPPKCPTTHSA